MRCARCGYVNAEGNRFCGMCGGELVAETRDLGASTPVARSSTESTVRERGPVKNAPVQNAPVRYTPVQQQPIENTVREVERAESIPVAASPESVAGSRFAPLAPPAPAARAIARPAESSSVVITGPSFLGLNRPAEGTSSGRSSDDLDYLLEEEEEPQRGWGKVVLVLVALVVLGGFGYLRWQQGGFAFITKGIKPRAQSQAVPSADSATPAAPGTADSAAAPPNSNPVIPVDGTSSVPAATSPAVTPPTTPASPDSAAPNAAAPTSATDAAPVADESKTADTGKADDSDTASADAESTATAAKPAPAKKIRQPKPSPILPVDNTATAERYIYGHGVRQDCDEGLRLLKPAAQANPKAMITLGTLYSTGTCTPRDLPTAYRWFAMALHKQPDNSALQDDLKKLWGQMTPPERQLAIRLSH